MNMLVLNNVILAIDPVDAGDSWRTEDQIIPKHVAVGASLVTVAGLPDDYAPGAYAYINGGFVKNQIAQPPIQVPTSCTRRQGQRALIQINKLGAVEAAIAAIADPTAKLLAKVDYEANTWERGNAFLQSMWASLGGTEADLDDLFRLAVTL